MHDIPNTVEKAMASLSRLDVDMCKLHAAGTIEMMKATIRVLIREDGTRPLLISVTQLTLTSEERMNKELLINGKLDEVVDALREVGAEMLRIASLFTYNMEKSKKRLEEANVQNVSLSNFDVMVEVAAKEGYIKDDDKERLIAFRNNPSEESWIDKK